MPGWRCPASSGHNVQAFSKSSSNRNIMTGTWNVLCICPGIWNSVNSCKCGMTSKSFSIVNNVVSTVQQYQLSSRLEPGLTPESLALPMTSHIIALDFG